MTTFQDQGQINTPMKDNMSNIPLHIFEIQYLTSIS